MAIDSAYLQSGWTNPYAQGTQGFLQGLQIAQVSQQQKLMEQQAAQKEQEQLRQQQQQEDLYNFSLIPNKTPDDYANIINRYPQLAEQYTKSWNIMNEGQQQQTFGTASQVYAALGNKNPSVAKEILDEQITGYENSGQKKEAFHLKRIKGMIDSNPDAALSSIGMLMSTVRPDEFKNIHGSLGSESRANEMQPYAVEQAVADINKTNAQTNDIPLAAEDRRQGVNNDTTKIEYQNDQFYSNLDQNQQQFYDGLDQKERLEAQKLAQNKTEKPIDKMERLEKVQAFANVARTSYGIAQRAETLSNDFKSINDTAGFVWNGAMRLIPGTNEYNFAQKIETLKNQIFLMKAEGMRGLGALTETEGARLVNSIESLDLSQDAKIVQQNLRKISQESAALTIAANRKTQIYATKGQGYSQAVIDAARELGITPAEAQAVVNQN